jgi:hypothetical protein
MMAATMVVLNENIPEIIATVVPGGSQVNARGLQQGKLDLGLVYVNESFDAWRGKDPFEGEHTNLRAIANYLNQPYSLGVRADSDIHSLKDLVGKNINAITLGSGSEAAINRLLAEHGITYDDIKAAGGKVEHLPYGPGVDAFRDRVLDMTVFGGGPPPDPAIVEVEAIGTPVRVLSIDEEILEQMREKYGYGWVTVPGGLFEGTPGPYNTLVYGAMVTARKDLPEDLIYKITKTIFENKERMGKRSKPLKNIDPQVSIEGVQIPFHTGAAQYYKEIGIQVESQP